MSLISFVKLEKENRIGKAIEDSLDLIQYKLPSDAKNIVIKPNMCYYWDWTTGQTTDPRFVAALVDVLRKKIGSHVDISIVESDASAMKCKHAFRMLGYERMAQEYNVKLVNLSEDKSDPTEVKVEGHSLHLMVPSTIQKADLKINVPKIKYMAASDVKITCALKNIYGCNPYPKKFRYHSKLAETIVAINKAMKFDLCIADGIVVSGIQPRKLGLVMASRDPVAFDVAAARIAGENPRKIRYIRLAHEEGLGSTTLIPKGEPLNYFETRYPRKSIEMRFRGIAYRLAVRTGLSTRLGLE
jgi:uncharacterized protein (DUF362 family)